MTNTEWDGCIFENVKFVDNSAVGAFFNGCTFHSCTFGSGDYAGMAVDGCVMQRVSFNKVAFGEVEFSNLQLKFCNFQDLSFEDASWTSSTLHECTFANISGSAELKGLIFRTCSAENFDASEMDIEHCQASDCQGLPSSITVVKGTRKRV